MVVAPVAVFIFNRPDCTSMVFDRIRAARPARLLVVADGPRTEAERKPCCEARLITEKINWDCKVSRLYSEANLGCGHRMSSGLDWVFSQEEAAIILEDDCVPDYTFFPYCEELLSRYRDECKVTMISGTSFEPRLEPKGKSYNFSRYAVIWGWATWARAWRLYDFRMKNWQFLRESMWPEKFFRSAKEAKYWRKKLDSVSSGQIDTWDYQWMLTCWSHGGLGVIPESNLVSNVGYDVRATHTMGPSRLANVPCHSITLPLLHPEVIFADARTDSLIFTTIFAPRRTLRSLMVGAKRRYNNLCCLVRNSFGLRTTDENTD